MRRVAILLGVAVLLGMAPAGARAARIDLTGTAGPAAEVFPLYVAGRGERNRLHLAFVNKGLRITDPGARGRIRFTKDGRQLCKPRGPKKVFCGGDFYADVRLGDRNDKLTVAPGGNGIETPTTDPLKLKEPDFSMDEGAPEFIVEANGGPGNDVLRGSDESDYLDPGPGRDTVDGRGGDDTILLRLDGKPDVVKGGGGIDEAGYYTKRRITGDLSAGRVSAAGEVDRVTGIERLVGGSAPDTLTGTARGDALYGDGGSDHIDGGGGNDFLSGAGVLIGGDGDDVTDARGTAANAVDCGPGSDRVASGPSSTLDPSCEAAVVSTTSLYDLSAGPLFSLTVPVGPVARDATSRTYEMACPSRDQDANGGCTGTIALSAPAGDASYGSGAFDLAQGASTNVRVDLNAAGQAAAAAGSPVAVHFTGELKHWTPATYPTTKIDFGWQASIGP